MEVADSFEGEVIAALQPFRITLGGIERGRHCLVNSGDALLLDCPRRHDCHDQKQVISGEVFNLWNRSRGNERPNELDERRLSVPNPSRLIRQRRRAFLSDQATCEICITKQAV
jgi:hypothetical protein